MTATRSLPLSDADTTAGCAGRSSAVVAAIKKSLENLWVIQVNELYDNFTIFKGHSNKIVAIGDPC